MKALVKFFISTLLLFNGIGAVYGGWNLIRYPDGSSLGMSLDYLEHSPFNDYFIPGIVLFVANGLCSLFILAALILGLKKYAWLVILQGAILSGWILIQIMMVQTIVALHIIMGVTGILLMLLGGYINRNDSYQRTINTNTMQ